MAKGFIRGALVGVVVSAAGLGTLSELTPLHPAHIPPAAPPKPVPPPASAPSAPAPAAAVTPGKAPASDATGTASAQAKSGTKTLSAVPGAEAAPDAGATKPTLGASPAAPPPATGKEAPAPAPATPSSESPATPPVAAPETAPETGHTLTPLPAPAPAPTPAPAPGASAAGTGAETGAVTPMPPASGPAIIPAPGQPKAGAPLPKVIDLGQKAAPALPEVEPGLPKVAGAPQPGFHNVVPGVKVNQLPTIQSPSTEAPVAEPETALAPDAPATRRYAVPFTNPNGLPLFSIVLIDTGGSGVDRAGIANLPLPITFAIDPTSPTAAADARLYREAGREVLVIAKGLAQDSTDKEIAKTIEGYTQAVPQAVGLIDPASDGFENDRALAQKIMPDLKSRGLGLVTYGQGLDAASQIAESLSVPAARVYRVLDAANESSAKIQRYLDRAAFKAAQEGRVVVVGHTTADTIAALSDWVGDPRSATVAPAPVTAALKP